MDDIDRLPWLEHERRARLREGALALRVVPPDPEWAIPQPVAVPEPYAVADSEGIGPIAKLRRASLNQCELCASPLSVLETEMGEGTCIACINRAKGPDSL